MKKCFYKIYIGRLVNFEHFLASFNIYSKEFDQLCMSLRCTIILVWFLIKYYQKHSCTTSHKFSIKHFKFTAIYLAGFHQLDFYDCLLLFPLLQYFRTTEYKAKHLVTIKTLYPILYITYSQLIILLLKLRFSFQCKYEYY